METRVAAISIILNERGSVEELNSILHCYGEYIIGRMGLPYKPKNIYVISLVVDADADTINGLAGRLGRLSGVSAKVTYSNEN